MALRKVDDCSKRIPIIDRTARVVRVDDDDGLGLVADQALDVVKIRHEPPFDVTHVVSDLAAIERCGSSPQRVVGAGHEDFVAGIQQRS